MLTLLSCTSSTLNAKSEVKIVNEELLNELQKYMNYLPEAYLYSGIQEIIVEVFKAKEGGYGIMFRNSSPIDCESYFGKNVYENGYTIYFLVQDNMNPPFFEKIENNGCSIQAEDNDPFYANTHFDERFYILKNGNLTLSMKDKL